MPFYLVFAKIKFYMEVMPFRRETYFAIEGGETVGQA